MKVKVNMNQQVLRQLSKAQAVSLAMTGQQMLNEIRNDQVMPFDTGNLQNESSHVDDSKARKGLVRIIHDAPYARRLYFHPEYSFRTDKNANAQGEWWEEWLSGSKRKRPIDLFRRFYRKNTGGYVR